MPNHDWPDWFASRTEWNKSVEGGISITIVVGYIVFFNIFYVKPVISEHTIDLF